MPKMDRFRLVVVLLTVLLLVQLSIYRALDLKRQAQTLALATATTELILIPTYTATPKPSPSNTPVPTPTTTPSPTSTPTSTSIPDPTATPTPTPAPISMSAPSPTPTSPPQAVTQPQKYGFSFGIQLHMIDVGPEEEGRIVTVVQDLGMRWVKQQIEWAIYEPQKGNREWGRLDNFVDRFAGTGTKILFSVVHAPKWARNPAGGNAPVDYQAFASFLSEMAQRYKGRVHAYEVWNEQNMNRDEAGPLISAVSYVDMLCIAYQAIKAADSEATVVSGAPTPTGWDDGIVAIRDSRYLRQMYSTGRLNGCSDAIGAHPSGFNNPPDKYRGYQNPEEPSFKGDPSFFYRETMEVYRRVMVDNGDGSKLLWPTEFGWASTPNPVAGYEYAANNTEEEKAGYIVQAYEMAKNWGFVGPMFLWNLNFGLVDPGSEKAAFAIVGPGWAKLPAYHAVKGITR